MTQAKTKGKTRIKKVAPPEMVRLYLDSAIVSRLLSEGLRRHFAPKIRAALSAANKWRGDAVFYVNPTITCTSGSSGVRIDSGSIEISLEYRARRKR